MSDKNIEELAFLLSYWLVSCAGVTPAVVRTYYAFAAFSLLSLKINTAFMKPASLPMEE